jgi:hypothetical protein
MHHAFFAKELEEIAEELGLDHDDYERLETYVSMNFTYPSGGNPQEAIMEDLDLIMRQEEEEFLGEHETGGDFARYWFEEFTTEHHSMPEWIVVDWEATWDNNLRHDFTFDNGYVWSNA